MAYIPFTNAEIAVGEPTSSVTFTKIKDNFINHESRIISIENGNNVIYEPIIFSILGQYDTLGAQTNIFKTTCNFNMTITGVRIIINEAGSSGLTEIDLKKSHAGGSYTSIFTTLPSVAYSAGNDAISSNAILDSGNCSLEAGDYLRLDTTAVQTAGRSFFIRVDFNKD